MLYSVVDDRSGVVYQEYHCVYGEDVEAALRFLFAAMTPKPELIQNTCKNRAQRFYGVVTKSGFGCSGSGGVSISRM
jgi:hypothetical protein